MTEVVGCHLRDYVIRNYNFLFAGPLLLALMKPICYIMSWRIEGLTCQGIEGSLWPIVHRESSVTLWELNPTNNHWVKLEDPVPVKPWNDYSPAWGKPELEDLAKPTPKIPQDLK